VLLDGFFEWKTVKKVKVPMFIRHADSYSGHTISEAGDHEEEKSETSKEEEEEGPCHAPLMLAALYDVWKADKESQEEVDSVSILTMEPDGTPMMSVHDRMPVFLTPETAALWLDPSAKWKDIIGTVVKNSQLHAQTQLLMYEVSPLVSNIRNESADCIVPKKDFDAKQLSKGIGRFFQKKTDVQAGPLAEKQMPTPSLDTPTGLKRKGSPDLESIAKVTTVIELD